MSTNGHIPQLDREVSLTVFHLAFGFLSKAFYEAPTADLLDYLVRENLFGDWPLESNDPYTLQGVELLQGYTQAWSPAALSDLEWDYTRLFIGPGPVLAPPWESVYLSREHLLFDQPTLDVRRAYAQFGLQAPRLNAEPDDHLGLEFGFMAHLCDLGLEAIRAGDRLQEERSLQAQRDFLSQHMLRWAPQCLELVVEKANTDYYRGIAYLTMGCLTQAAAFLDVSIPVGVRP